MKHVILIVITVLLIGFSSIAVLAQVTPRVCVETSYQTGTVTLAQAAAPGDKIITVNGYVPPFVALVINPGGATEERLNYVNIRIDGSGPYTLSFNETFHGALSLSGFNCTNCYYDLQYAHSAGETVKFEGYYGTASFGYRNAGNSAVTIPRSVTSHNFFTPGPTSYGGQPNQFQPGIHDNVLVLPFGGQAADTLTWVLGGTLGSNNSANAAIARNGQGQGCATITYQGRLTDAGGAANGQYDLRFTAYDALTDGTVQSSSIPIENVQVTNGIFTVQLNFGSAFTGNDKAKFLEIAVRPGASSGTDPFTTLTPRQPITSVPFAINAQKAFSVSGGFVQLPLTTVAPSSEDCNETKEYGQTRVDAAGNKLYICMTTGWKAFAPQ